MKVLVVHNDYRSGQPSGENIAVEQDVGLLRSAGVEVVEYMRSSDEIGVMTPSRRLAALSSPLTGRASRSGLKTLLAEEQPDVVHLHNVYPLISPNVIDWATDAGVPVVASVHNFRFRCLNGQFFREGQVCTKCEEARIPLPGIWHACYRGSALQSAVQAAAVGMHGSRWAKVACFLPVSDFVAERLVAWGVQPERIRVKPNFTRDPGLPLDVGNGFLFAGRLTVEKGVNLLLAAWQRSGLGRSSRLVFAGDGPLRADLEALALRDRSIEVLGSLSHGELIAQRWATAVAVVPSLSFETFGLGVIEAFAAQRPVVATKSGALASLVDASVGWSCDADIASLAEALVDAASAREQAIRGHAARRRFESRFSPEQIARQVLDLYAAVVA